MPRPEAPRLSQLVVELRDQQHRRWLAGDRVTAEALLNENPQIPPDSEHALELVYGEVLLREQWGESPRLEDVAARFPALADQLAALFEVHRALDLEHLLLSTQVDADSGQAPPTGARGATLPTPVVDGYEILGELGRGGMGVVYRARHLGLNRVVALKMILAGSHADATQIARFRAEAEAVARLQHPNIVQIYDVGEQDGRPFFALELIEGGSLANRLNGIPQAAERAAEWSRTLARAVDAAHRKGIIHRDLTPSNILVADDGALKIVDFGLAKLLGGDAALTRTESVMGSPNYMAPEQAMGMARDVGPVSDVYALGAILYELLTGRPPFRGASALETLEQVKQTEPVRPGRLQPRLSRDLETICLKCLEKEPARRYPTAGALADELDRFLRHEPILARPIGPLARAARWCRHRPALAAASGLAALALLAVLVVSLSYGVHQARAARDLRAALDESRRLSTRLTLERALTFCEQGDVDRGMLGLAHSLEMVVPLNDAPLERVIRSNLTGWSMRLHPLRHCLEHHGNVGAIAFSPDGATIATGSHDGTARLWDTASGRLASAPLAHSGPVRSVAFSHDGQTLLTVEQGGPARRWKRATGEALAPAMEHPGAILAVAFRPDDAAVLTAGADGAVRFWDALTGRAIGPVLRHDRAVRVAAFGPNGRTVLTGSDDATAGLWDAASGQILHRLRHDSPVRAVSIRPDGKMVVTGCEDGTARIWDVATGRPVGASLQHDAGITVVAFSPDGRTILTASRDWRARLWNSATGGLVVDSMRHQAPVTAAAFGPGGRRLLTGSRDRTARIWNAATSLPVGTALAHAGEIDAVAFSPDGRAALTAGSLPVAKVWELRDDEPEPTPLPYAAWPNAMAYSPDGRTIAIGGGGPDVWLYEVASGQALGPPLHHDGEVTALAFSNDGRALASGGDDRAVHLWDAASGRPIRTPLPLRDKLQSVAFSPDDRRILAGTRSGKVGVWDISEGRMLAERQSHRGPVLTVAFSRDGGRFLTGGADHVARLWRTAALDPIGAPLPHEGQVWAVAFSPEGRLAVTGGADKTLHVWDAATAAPAGPPIVEGLPIRAVAVGPGGRTVFIGSWSSGMATSRLWDLSTRQPLGPSLPHRGIVLTAAFDASGGQVRVGIEDKTLRTLPVPPPMEGDADRLVLLVQHMTGRIMGHDGRVELLGPQGWLERDRRLSGGAGKSDR